MKIFLVFNFSFWICLHEIQPNMHKINSLNVGGLSNPIVSDY